MPAFEDLAAVGWYLGDGGIAKLRELKKRKTVSRAAARVQWNFSAGCRIKGDRRSDWVQDPVTAFGWQVEYRAGRWGTDMNGASEQVDLRLNTYPPYIRGWAQW